MFGEASPGEAVTPGAREPGPGGCRWPAPPQSMQARRWEKEGERKPVSCGCRRREGSGVEGGSIGGKEPGRGLRVLAGRSTVMGRGRPR